MPVNEVLVADIQLGGHQAADFDLCVGPEQQAIGIDEKHLTIGLQGAVDDRCIPARHTIERHGRGSRLHERDLMAVVDIEALPIENRFGRGLRDGHVLMAHAHRCRPAIRFA
ncbi:hypothetical protein D3C86_1759920 [compost metagenome]